MQDTFRPSQSLFPSNTALVIVALFIVALIGSWNFYVRNSPAVPSPIVTPTPLAIVVTPTPTPQLPTTQTYTDPQGKFSFIYPSQMVTEESSVTDVLYLTTPGKKYYENALDYQIEIHVLRSNIPALSTLQKVPVNTPEESFLDQQTATKSGTITYITRTFRDGWQFTKKKIIYTPKLVILLTGTGTNHALLDGVTDTLTITNPQSSTKSATKITGTITEADTGCFVDGICKIKVNGTWVILATGERMPTNPPVESGVLLGLNGISPASIGDMGVGRSVEVYAAKSPNGDLTLQGKNTYYVKLLK